MMPYCPRCTDDKGVVLSIGESMWNDNRFVWFYAYEFTASLRQLEAILKYGIIGDTSIPTAYEKAV